MLVQTQMERETMRNCMIIEIVLRVKIEFAVGRTYANFIKITRTCQSGYSLIFWHGPGDFQAA